MLDWLWHFFDPAHDGFDGEDAVRVSVLAAALYATYRAIRRFVVRHLEKRQDAMESRLLAALEERTQPIQPDSNGGKSLADLHYKIDTFVTSQESVNTLLVARQGEIAAQLYKHMQQPHGGKP